MACVLVLIAPAARSRYPAKNAMFHPLRWLRDTAMKGAAERSSPIEGGLRRILEAVRIWLGEEIAVQPRGSFSGQGRPER